jgi:serine phosphatase RsbU (regulator of sigma subunit)
MPSDAAGGGWEGAGMAVLVRMEGSHQGKWVYSVGSRCVLGRHAECDISDLFSDNGSVSRFHAILELTGGRYTIEDKGSRNGTYVNGERITGRQPLRSGDRLDIAGVQLTFIEEADAVGSAASASPVAVDLISYDDTPDGSVPVSSRVLEVPGVSVAPQGYSPDRFRALVRMLQRLGRALEINATLQELLDGLFAIFPQAHSGFVAFTVDGPLEVTPRATRFRRQDPNQRVSLSRKLIHHVLSRREAVLWTDHEPGRISFQSLKDLHIRSLICAPLLDSDGQPFGVVQIDTNDSQRAFTAEDLDVMLGAVSQGAVAVRFAQLHEEALRRQAVAQDLELARRVQLGLLPEGYPEWEGFEFFAYYRAAYEVGGDYYDFIELPNERLALLVADAAGKGVSAALMMAKLSGELKYHLSCKPPAAALAQMNESLCSSSTGRFVTLLAMVLDRRAKTLTIVNAGHPAPLLRRPNGNVQALGESARGMALGLMPEQTYSEVKTALQPGELCLAYTDGFTEATNSAGKMFGVGRLGERLASAPAVVRECGDQIVHEVLNFLGDQPQSDDMCLVGLGLPTTAAERTVQANANELDRTKTKQ